MILDARPRPKKRNANPGPAVPGTTKADSYGPRELFAVVDAAFSALPDKHRQVVRLVDVDGLTYAEAAELLGIPEGTVMSRLHRARASFRKAWKS